METYIYICNKIEKFQISIDCRQNGIQTEEI
ncbi:hypothetical protein M2101_000120 [Parabacteroides sp. PM5-20]|nr:hypothetical protein [Parabacteroides sp. PM5-20]